MAWYMLYKYKRCSCDVWGPNFLFCSSYTLGYLWEIDRALRYTRLETVFYSGSGNTALVLMLIIINCVNLCQSNLIKCTIM